MTAAAIEIAGVWKYFGDYPALRDIHLTIAPGVCLALIGRNGAGKTTLLRILAGFSRPGKGAVSIAGRRQIGFLGHGISVYDELSALENLILFGRLYELSNPAAAAHQWLERVGLDRVKTGLVREFSRGMRQRLALARAFVHDPSVLLLDEPFTSLDDRAIAVLQDLVRGAREEGRTVVMSTHQLREALDLATDAALLQRGKLVWSGPRSEQMLADPGYLYAQYGEP